jgi:hypothetical protein
MKFYIYYVVCYLYQQMHIYCYLFRYLFIYLLRLFSLVLQPSTGYGLLVLEVSRSRTTTRHIQYVSSGRVISSSQRPIPDNTQQTNIHASGEISTHDLSWRAALDRAATGIVISIYIIIFYYKRSYMFRRLCSTARSEIRCALIKGVRFVFTNHSE